MLTFSLIMLYFSLIVGFCLFKHIFICYESDLLIIENHYKCSKQQFLNTYQYDPQVSIEEQLETFFKDCDKSLKMYNESRTT